MFKFTVASGHNLLFGLVEPVTFAVVELIHGLDVYKRQALALAKYMNSYSFSIKKEKCAFILGFIILLPMLLIIGQRETGSALVYLAFFLVLYREGMPGVVLFAGVCAVIYFVVGIRFDEVFIADTPTPVSYTHLDVYKRQPSVR